MHRGSSRGGSDVCTAALLIERGLRVKEGEQVVRRISAAPVPKGRVIVKVLA